MANSVSVNDAVWRQLREKIGGLVKRRVRVGVLGSEMAEGDNSNITLAELAAIHEYGAPNAGIPERSFIRRTFRNERDGMTAMCVKLAKAVINDRMDIDRALALLGTWAVAKIQASIRSNIPPPLQPETVARKGSSVALIDTGQLINGVTYEVVDDAG
jgi:hypothetical protein